MPTRKTIPAALLLTFALPAAHALLPPQEPTPAAGKAFRHSDLTISALYRPPADLAPELSAALAADLAVLGVDPANAFYDQRSGRWGTLILRHHLLPGAGLDATAIAAAARDAFAAYLAVYAGELRIDPAELAEPAVTAHDGGRMVQIHAAREIGGLAVRDSYLTAVVHSGNLILFGARAWGDVTVATTPSISAAAARAALEAHLGALAIDHVRRAPRLEIVPLARGGDPLAVPAGAGYDFRLAWVLSPGFAGDHGGWEALVDAHSGALLAFEDTNHYATTRRVQGGVLPVSNDLQSPDGVEQADWPMPFADVLADGQRVTTDSGGNLPLCYDGELTTRLDSRFIRMLDQCEPSGQTTSVSTVGGGDLDLGITVPGGTDCSPVIDPVTSIAPGNTRASRTGFYELNRIKEQARGQLPANQWLQDQLTSNMNIPNVCNAFWNGVTVNFYRFSGACANTGEIAGVFDHEWGHGLDNFDAAPFVSNPGEGIADIYMALRLDTSCIGRGFSAVLGCNSPASGADPCINDCDGVRDIDWANRQSQQPHDIAWIDANCGGGPAPCGGGVHCEGAVYAEAVWDLMKRDLPAAFGMNADTALEMATRLTYRGAGLVGRWYNCVNGAGVGDGCNADGGYLNYLAADDDNGSLLDGTPHMAAIHAAFARHGIACPAPAVSTSGCAGAPAAAPAVSATPLDRGARLAWTAVAGATRYEVFRTEGVFGCDFGKTKVGETTGLGFDDSGLRNGREHYYTVAAIGGGSSCLGPMSACTAVTPAPGPNLAVDEASAALAVATGDGDPFLDNCEQAEVTFDVHNTGAATQSNVRIAAVEPLSHPGIEVTTALPAPVAASLAPCAAAAASFAFTASGLAFQDEVVFRVELTSDELGGVTRAAILRFREAESDFELTAEKTFDFETGLEAWQTTRGTFQRATAGGGAGGSATYMASSAFLDGQCDQVHSPLIRLTPASTLSLSNQFEIEGQAPTGVWYDRGNVGVVDLESGVRTLVSPDGGRTYNVPDGAANGTCGTDGQAGWAGAGPGWAESTWSATALGSAGFAGKFVKLAVHYGTDPASNGFGLWFDQVRLNDFELQVVDGQSDTCGGGNQPPVAVDDAVSTPEGTAVTIAVLANDRDAEGDPLTVVAVQSPTAEGGAAAINPDQTVTYTPPAGFASPPDDTFTYTVSDGQGTDTATVTVTVQSSNLPPVAQDDAAVTARDTAVTFDLLANDSDPNGDPLAVESVGAPGSGTVVDHGDGTVTYTPQAGFTGVDTFSYVVGDGRATDSAAAFVTVTQNAGEGPCVEPGITLLTDPAGDATTQQAAHDVLSLSLAQPAALDGGKFVFTLKMRGLEVLTPDTTWPAIFRDGVGTDRFVRMATNALGQVTFAYGTGTNPNPLVAAGTPADPASSFAADGTIRIVVPPAAVGNPGFAQQLQLFLTRIRVGETPAGAATPDNMPNSLARAGAYVVDDCRPALPDAVDDAAATALNTPVTIAVLANDRDVRGRPLAVSAVQSPSDQGGSVTTDGSTVTYTPRLGFLGEDRFTYTACTPDGACDTAAVTVTVHCPPAPTGGFSDTFEPAAQPGWQVETAANAMGPASPTWQVVADPLAQSPIHSFFTDATTLDLKDDRLLSPPLALSATSRLSFWHRFFFESSFDGGVLEVSTDGGATWTDVLAGGGAFVEGGYNGTISPDFGSPIAGRPAWTAFSQFIDAPNRVVVDLGAFAGFGRLLRWRFAGDPLVLGSLPGSGWWVDDVEVRDLLVSPESCPLAPEAEDDAVTTQEDTAVTIAVLANDRDPNGDPLALGDLSNPAHGTAVANADQTVTYTPAPGFFGTDTFTYEACDPGALCDTATVTVAVEQRPDAGLTRASGSGWIPAAGGGRAHFGFDARRSEGVVQGRLSYKDEAAGIQLKGSVGALAFPAADRAELGGTCELAGGQPCSFQAQVEDHGAGATDRFAIQVFDGAGNLVHQAAGTLGGGNIRLR
jgi:hypothetical protein